MSLKAQDTLLALKYWSLKISKLELSVRGIAEELGMSPSEVSKGSKRLVFSHLAVERSGSVFAETRNLVEWLNYGVRFAYPLEQIGYGRGIASSWNCPLVESEMVLPNLAMVWPSVGGDSEGILIKPMYDSIPFAAKQDKNLYHALSLIDAIRGGRPRELSIARNLVNKLIGTH